MYLESDYRFKVQTVSATLSMPSPGFRLPRISRTLGIVLCVLGLHILAIWALQAGLLHRAFNLVEPEVITVELLEAPRPVQAPPPPAPPPPQVQKPVAKPQPPKPAPAPVLAPVITKDPPPPTAPVAVEAPPQPAAPINAPVQASAPPSPPAPSPPAPPSPRVEMPLSDAAYLRNPPPSYPAVSQRLREEGTATVRVLVSVDGLPLKIELQKSTGFPRLDESALKTIQQWKFVPGKRGGTAEQMWVEVPVLFALVKK